MVISFGNITIINKLIPISIKRLVQIIRFIFCCFSFEKQFNLSNISTGIQKEVSLNETLFIKNPSNAIILVKINKLKTILIMPFSFSYITFISRSFPIFILVCISSDFSSYTIISNKSLSVVCIAFIFSPI